MVMRDRADRQIAGSRLQPHSPEKSFIGFGGAGGLQTPAQILPCPSPLGKGPPWCGAPTGAVWGHGWDEVDLGCGCSEGHVPGRGSGGGVEVKTKPQHGRVTAARGF